MNASPAHCSFCGRAITPSMAAAAAGDLNGAPHPAICGQCLELAAEFLEGPAPAEPAPNLPCSFCAGGGNGTPRRTVPGPGGVAICGPCVEERKRELRA